MKIDININIQLYTYLSLLKQTMSDYEAIIDLCEVEDNKPVYKKSSFKIVDYVMFCIGSGFILLFLYTTGFLYLPIIQMINTAKLYALDNTTEIEIGRAHV